MHSTVNENRQHCYRLLKKKSSSPNSARRARSDSCIGQCGPSTTARLSPQHQLTGNNPSLAENRSGTMRSSVSSAIQLISNTNYKSATSSIQQDVVRTANESSSSKLPIGRPPPIATAEQTLPRKTRTTLAQLRTGHSRILGQYMNRIDPTARNHCHNCGQSPHDTHHLFHCPSKLTTLTVESLWTALTETAKHLNLAIDETS